MILEEIVAYKKSEVEVLKNRFSINCYAKSSPLYSKGRFKNALEGPGIKLIAEVKKASPSKGILKEDLDPAELAGKYQEAGAAVISVLTDTHFFQGSVEDLITVKSTVHIPVLRKDFIIDPCQIYEACQIGADAILLIASVLDNQKLKCFIKLAGQLGLDALVEVHCREELTRALDCGGEIIGINNRDLKTFQLDIGTTLELAPLVPKSCVLVSESGIHSRTDIKLIEQAGVNAVLVGEALVTAADVTIRVKELLGG
ncbi:MAG: indole-3-glycerol phosphate synthase TrpC [Dehalobacterium sp.]